MKERSFDLERFNASQREAVCHGCGPALVLAGPGSGKTTVITKRIQYLTQVCHIPPQEILVVTFTKAAALEMQQRFEALLQSRSQVRFGTFHAVFYHILQEHSGNHLTLLTEKEKQDYIRRILRRERIGEELASVCLEAFVGLKGGGAAQRGSGAPQAESGGAGVCQTSAVLSREQIEAAFSEYRQICRKNNKLDFDDMAYECLQLFERRPDVLRLWQRRCRYILADEYQDISPIQERILFLLAMPENNLFLVGDDDQSVYGFRGAEPESMLSFPKRYPETRKIILETNYRCRPDIIRAASAVVRENKSRFGKKQIPGRERSGEGEVVCKGFADRETQDREVVRLLQELRRRGCLSQAAVLFRTNGDAQGLIRLLNKAGIPYVSAGKGKGGNAHFVREDIAAYLRLLSGDRSRKNFYKIMNRPDRQIDREVCGSEVISFPELAKAHSYDKYVIKNIQKLERDCERASHMKPFAALMYIRKETGYETWLGSTYKGGTLEEAMQVLTDIQELAGRMENIEELERYLTDTTQEGRRSAAGGRARSGEGVRIMTYHGSKGLEFDYVVMPDLNEGSVPHKKASTEKEIEEERRMFYVAMTRAREKLYLYYRTGTKEEPETMSRFLKPIRNLSLP